MSGVERKLTVFNSGSLSLGRLFGIPFQLHWSVLLVALVASVLLTTWLVHSAARHAVLFADFDTTSNRLGNTVRDKNIRLAAVLKGVAELDFGDFDASHIDLFGDAYEFLISNYAANAGKSGGEFFTPQHVSKLIAQLAMHKQTSVNKIYDPACGSGSLLLQAKKHFDEHLIEDGFYGQELNHTTYNLARMNMFLHNVNYDKFNIQLGNTLEEPHFAEDRPIDAIVSNPPYSVKWKGSDDPTLINDDRFAPAGVLAPKSKADFAFVLHALSYLSSKGRAAIVCFPGIFYRGGAEQKIRQYLVDNNYVETVISLAPSEASAWSAVLILAIRVLLVADQVIAAVMKPSNLSLKVPPVGVPPIVSVWTSSVPLTGAPAIASTSWLTPSMMPIGFSPLDRGGELPAAQRALQAD